MSATGRGAERREADWYPTPAWCTRALLAAVPDIGRDHVLDPCAGDGAILRVLREAGATPWAIESRAECRDDLLHVCGHEAVIIGDGLYGRRPWSHDVVTNPPYRLAQEFVRRWTTGGRKAAFLLRLNFLGGQRRAEWWQEHAPAQVWVLPRRPSFTGRGTDATEYAWFVWGLPPLPVRVLPLDWCR